MAKKYGKGGGPPPQTHHPKSSGMTAAERQTLKDLGEKAEKRAEKEKTRKLVNTINKEIRKAKGLSSSSETDSDDPDSDDSDPDAGSKKKKKSQSKKRKKEKQKKKKASSSDGDDSSSKGTSKSKKKKLSKLHRLHQELQGLKTEVDVQKTEKNELTKQLKEKFAKLESQLVEGKSVLFTPDKVAPLTREDLAEVLADAGSKASEKAEASRPKKGVMAWLDEVSLQSTPTSTTAPHPTTPSKQVLTIAAVLREWLQTTADDQHKYGSLEDKNPSLGPKGTTLCTNIAKKVSSWFQTPVDIGQLKTLVDDFKLRTEATTSGNMVKAILIALLARGFDYNPEQLLVSKADILAMTK